MAAAVRAQLSALAAELRGGRRQDRLRDALDEVMRVQALLVADPEAAVACLDGLEVDAEAPEPLRQLARDLFTAHRRRMDRIRAGELSRAGFVARRAAQRPATKRRSPGDGRAVYDTDAARGEDVR